MRNPINKRIFRQFKYKPLKVFPILIALSFIVVFASSFFTAQQSIKKLYYKQIDEGKVEDGEFQTIYELTDDLQSKIEALGLKLYENYYFEEKIDSDKVLRIFKNRKNINEALPLEGSLAKKSDEITMSAYFSRNNNIKVGDKITLADKTYTVASLASFPDYSSALKNRNDLVMDTGHFGIATLPEKAFDDVSDKQITFLYSYHTNENLDKKEAREILKSISKIVNKDNLMVDGVTRFDNKCITYIMDDMGGDVPMMTIATALLFIAIAFISSVQIKSIIEEEAPIIGTLLASGYRNRELLKNYMSMPLFLVLISSLIGNAAAYLYVYKKYAEIYYRSFDLPSFEPFISPRSFLITSIMPMILYLIINYAVISRSLNMSPVNFLRRNFKKSKAKSRFHLKNLSFIKKFKLRVIFANKLTYVSLLFGVFIANLLLMFALSAKPIFNIYAENMKTQMKYAHTYIVKSDMDKLDAPKVTIISADLADKNDESVQIYGIDDDTKYDSLNISSLQNDEAVISNGLAKRFEYKIGDTIKIREPYNSKEKNIKVKAVDSENNYFQIFTKRTSLNKIINRDYAYFNAYMSDNALNVSKENLVTEINRDEMSKFMIHFLDSFSVVFTMIQMVAVAFYFILLLMVTELIIERAKLNMTYLKIFGFRDNEITKIYVNTSFLILLFFQIILIPILYKIMKYLYFISMQKFDAYIKVTIPLNVFLLSYLMTIVIFVLCQAIERRKIGKIDMVKELKTIAG